VSLFGVHEKILQNERNNKPKMAVRKARDTGLFNEEEVSGTERLSMSKEERKFARR
jgi:hypothetical protein